MKAFYEESSGFISQLHYKCNMKNMLYTGQLSLIDACPMKAHSLAFKTVITARLNQHKHCLACPKNQTRWRRYQLRIHGPKCVGTFIFTLRQVFAIQAPKCIEAASEHWPTDPGIGGFNTPAVTVSKCPLAKYSTPIASKWLAINLWVNVTRVKALTPLDQRVDTCSLVSVGLSVSTK